MRITSIVFKDVYYGVRPEIYWIQILLEYTGIKHTLNFALGHFGKEMVGKGIDREWADGRLKRIAGGGHNILHLGGGDNILYLGVGGGGASDLTG